MEWYTRRKVGENAVRMRCYPAKHSSFHTGSSFEVDYNIHTYIHANLYSAEIVENESEMLEKRQSI